MTTDYISIKDSSLTGDKACLKIRAHFDKKHKANFRLNEHKIKSRANNVHTKVNGMEILRVTELRHAGKMKETDDCLPQLNLTIVDIVPKN